MARRGSPADIDWIGRTPGGLRPSGGFVCPARLLAAVAFAVVLATLVVAGLDAGVVVAAAAVPARSFPAGLAAASPVADRDRPLGTVAADCLAAQRPARKQVAGTDQAQDPATRAGTSAGAGTADAVGAVTRPAVVGTVARVTEMPQRNHGRRATGVRLRTLRFHAGLGPVHRDGPWHPGCALPVAAVIQERRKPPWVHTTGRAGHHHHHTP